MSVRALAYVKTLDAMPATGARLRPSQKLLLMVLADYYNDEERAAWPSLRRLATESLVSRRHAITLLQDCDVGGVLKIRSRTDSRGGHTSNHYRFIEIDPIEPYETAWIDPSEVSSPPPGEESSLASEAIASPPGEALSSPPSELASSPKPLDNKTDLTENTAPDWFVYSIWSATIESINGSMPSQLARDIPGLKPIGLVDGVLRLRAPSQSVVDRWQRRAADVLPLIQRSSPVPVERIEVVR